MASSVDHRKIRKMIEDRKSTIKDEQLFTSRLMCAHFEDINTASTNVCIQYYWQDYLDEIDSDMEIIRIEKDPSKEYRIFYVSDNRFADGNLFPDFLKFLKAQNPRWRIVLRHIRDIDGHFVTRDEFFARRPEYYRKRPA